MQTAPDMMFHDKGEYFMNSGIAYPVILMLSGFDQALSINGQPADDLHSFDFRKFLFFQIVCNLKRFGMMIAYPKENTLDFRHQN
jgi:hypothetical protein